jgi:hypothetical protein
MMKSSLADQAEHRIIKDVASMNDFEKKIWGSRILNIIVLSIIVGYTVPLNAVVLASGRVEAGTVVVTSVHPHIACMVHLALVETAAVG